jgi:hypothetical protein
LAPESVRTPDGLERGKIGVTLACRPRHPEPKKKARGAAILAAAVVGWGGRHLARRLTDAPVWERGGR